MKCNCSKTLGCFLPNEIVDFGITSPCDGDFIFEIFGPSGVTLISVPFVTGDPITIPFTFNENGETMIKIKTPCAIPGLTYITSNDGACCFLVNGTVPSCN